jgi:hypothetical protein
MDVVLRLATAVFAAVLAGLSSLVSPLVVVWLGTAALAAQVLVELSGHEAHLAR